MCVMFFLYKSDGCLGQAASSGGGGRYDGGMQEAFRQAHRLAGNGLMWIMSRQRLVYHVWLRHC